MHALCKSNDSTTRILSMNVDCHLHTMAVLKLFEVKDLVLKPQCNLERCRRAFLRGCCFSGEIMYWELICLLREEKILCCFSIEELPL